MPICSGSVGGKPGQAPDHHPQRRALQPSHRHPRVHVRWRGQCCSGKIKIDLIGYKGNMMTDE